MSNTSKTAKINLKNHKKVILLTITSSRCFVHLYLLFYYNNKVFMLMVNYKPSAFHGHEDTEP